MVVLKAIGAFFVKIGRWIRDTAWVQPLLIVGGIFAIIFAIPHIINGFENLFDVNEAVAYYNNFDLSINGADSKGDQLFNYLEKYAKNEDVSDLKAKYGEKFFITFVTETGDNSHNYEGYETLASESKKAGAIELKDGAFKLYTIYLDEKNKDDEKCFSEEKDNFYARHVIFFENLSSLDECPYAENYGVGYGDTLNNITDNPESLVSNTAFLIDLTANKPAHTNLYGVSEVFFSLNGSDKYSKAYFLRDCWNHAGVFAE